MIGTLLRAVVLVTHDIADAVFVADRIVLLRGGRVVQQGTRAGLVRARRDPFVTSFVNAQRSPLDSIGDGQP